MESADMPKPDAARSAARATPAAPDLAGFAVGDAVMHPAHGVGRVTGQSSADVGGEKLELVHFAFGEGRLLLRVPRAKVVANGIRRLAGGELIAEALEVLTGTPRGAARGITWARRAAELQAKLNSGDPRKVAEVLRDLSRNVNNPERSFSERQIFEAALERLSVEIAAVENTTREAAVAKIAQRIPVAPTPIAVAA
ncbi:CarD family transcriptional regulator [Falsiroseomonas oryziterrae]|uniref:CarD family transcriptional regulator n=1 Tax=Falsiroseomonas oryziterrae TaxID=2911368 RepID=UPI001F23A5AE|nr:CarD family transcriptional regulator [Roseomonas sp. NPKOSM-4]